MKKYKTKVRKFRFEHSGNEYAQNKSNSLKIFAVSDWIDFGTDTCMHIENQMIMAIIRFSILFQWFTSSFRKCLDCLDLFSFVFVCFCISAYTFFSKDYCLRIFVRFAILCQRTKDAMRRFSDLLWLLLDFACIEFIYLFLFYFYFSCDFLVSFRSLSRRFWYICTTLELFSTRLRKINSIYIRFDLGTFVL